MEVTAWAQDNPPPYMVADLRTGKLNYYASAEALPCGGLTNDLYRTEKLVMRRIPAGGDECTVGAPSDVSRIAVIEDQHDVAFSQDYRMGVFELTIRQYRIMARLEKAKMVSGGY